MTNLCQPWATESDVCSPCTDVYASELIDYLQSASEILYELTGHQFNGICTETITPCNSPNTPGWPVLASNDLLRAIYSASSSSLFPWFGCGCHSQATCSCTAHSSIELPRFPIAEVTEVVTTEDGTLDPALYRLDGNFLVRLDTHAWPCCDEDFTITYTWGSAPPLTGIRAAAILACELFMTCNPDAVPGTTCRLPRNITSISRQGVSVIFERLTRVNGPFRFGIPEIDIFLEAFAPYGPGQQSVVMTPDSPSFRRIP